MIKIPKELKGKLRENAVLKTLQSNINYSNLPDEDGMCRVELPCHWYEDTESVEAGLENMLEQENFTIKIPKERIDIINGFMYDGIMELEKMEKGVKV